jgi:hypothetical protein
MQPTACRMYVWGPRVSKRVLCMYVGHLFKDLTNFTGIQKFSEQHFIGFVLNAWGKPMVKS